MLSLRFKIIPQALSFFDKRLHLQNRSVFHSGYVMLLGFLENAWDCFQIRKSALNFWLLTATTSRESLCNGLNVDYLLFIVCFLTWL